MKLRNLVLIASLAFGGTSCSTIPEIEHATSNQNNLEGIVNATFKTKGTMRYKENFFLGTVNLGCDNQRQVSYGSAFAFAREGTTTYFATAKHCVHKIPKQKTRDYNFGLIKSKIEIETNEIEIIKCGEDTVTAIAKLRELASDENNDVAILIGENLDPNEFPIYNCFIDPKLIKLGDEVYSVGFPHSYDPEIDKPYVWGKNMTRGIVSCLTSGCVPIKTQGYVFTDCTLDRGMSGGPTVLIHKGVPLIAGINAMRLPHLNDRFGISLGILDLIEEYNLADLIKKHDLCK